MLVKDHEAIDFIENKMGFNFKELELITRTKLITDALIYKSKNDDLFLFEKYGNDIGVIYKIQKDGFYREFSYNGDVYIYHYIKCLSINFYIEKKRFVFEDGYICEEYYYDKSLKFADEELVLNEMLGYFLNEEEVLKNGCIIKKK